MTTRRIAEPFQHATNGNGSSISTIGKKKRRSLFSCFNMIMCLVVVEVVCLLSVGFFSDSLTTTDPWTGPLAFLHLSYTDQGHDDDLYQLEDRMAQKTEEKLDRMAQQLETTLGEKRSNDDESSGVALDDYYSRPHIPKTIPVPLVVGGSDGSGTRAFVDVLGKLGVPMLVDDPQSLDVHGGALYGGKGWPPLASLVLQATHSANYEVKDMPEKVKNEALRELRKLKQRFTLRFAVLMKKTREKDSNVKVATGVSYGMKAPISMALVPLMNELHGPMKFLHIVRDGRDVALSKNQSPVQKFYKNMYLDADDRMAKYSKALGPVLAMHLWNDWNAQLLEWEKSHADGQNFDFLVMRTEDLLDPEKKFESLLQLADFVGSPKTIEEICCMSRKAVVDMGQSVLVGQNDKPNGKSLQDKGRNARTFREMWAAHHPNLNLMTKEERRKAVQEFGAEMAAKIGETEDSKRQEGGGGPGNDDARQDRFQKLAKLLNLRKRTDPVGRLVTTPKKSTENIDEILPMVRRRRLLEVDLLERHPGVAKKTKNHLKQHQVDGPVGNIKTKTGHAQQVQEKKAQVQEKSPPVHQRYGKWAEGLKDQPELSDFLHREGAVGLSAFGYEPQVRFRDHARTMGSFQCDETVVCPLDVKQANATKI